MKISSKLLTIALLVLSSTQGCLGELPAPVELKPFQGFGKTQELAAKYNLLRPTAMACNALQLRYARSAKQDLSGDNKFKQLRFNSLVTTLQEVKYPIWLYLIDKEQWGEVAIEGSSQPNDSTSLYYPTLADGNVYNGCLMMADNVEVRLPHLDRCRVLTKEIVHFSFTKGLLTKHEDLATIDMGFDEKENSSAHNSPKTSAGMAIVKYAKNNGPSGIPFYVPKGSIITKDGKIMLPGGLIPAMVELNTYLLSKEGLKNRTFYLYAHKIHKMVVELAQGFPGIKVGGIVIPFFSDYERNVIENQLNPAKKSDAQSVIYAVMYIQNALILLQSLNPSDPVLQQKIAEISTFAQKFFGYIYDEKQKASTSSGESSSSSSSSNSTDDEPLLSSSSSSSSSATPMSITPPPSPRKQQRKQRSPFAPDPSQSIQKNADATMKDAN